MDAIIIGIPTDGFEIPPSNLGGGPPLGDGPPGGVVYDSLPSDTDWFGELMREAGFDDNYYFEQWNEATKTYHWDYSSWESSYGDTESWGDSFNVTSGDYVFHVENSVAKTFDGYETWRTTYTYQGQLVGSLVQTYRDSDNSILIHTTDRDGNSTEYRVHNARLIDGVLYTDISW